jgi:hypothetical protein
MSAQKRQTAIKKNALITNLKPHPQFKMYDFFIDKYADDKVIAQKQQDQYN